MRESSNLETERDLKMVGERKTLPTLKGEGGGMLTQACY